MCVSFSNVVSKLNYEVLTLYMLYFLQMNLVIVLIHIKKILVIHKKALIIVKDLRFVHNHWVPCWTIFSIFEALVIKWFCIDNFLIDFSVGAQIASKLINGYRSSNIYIYIMLIFGYEYSNTFNMIHCYPKVISFKKKKSIYILTVHVCAL